MRCGDIKLGSWVLFRSLASFNDNGERAELRLSVDLGVFCVFRVRAHLPFSQAPPN